MNLSFNIDYRTRWGESVYITGDIPALGNGDKSKALKLNLYGEQTWKTRVTLPDTTGDFTYSYFIRHDNGYEKYEWGKGHSFRSGKGVPEYEIYDRWQDMPWDKPDYSVVFTDCVCKRNLRAVAPRVRPGELLLSIDAPMIAPDEVLAVSGGCDALGNWDVSKAVVLSDAFFPTWSCAVKLASLPAEFEYKFLILKGKPRGRGMGGRQQPPLRHPSCHRRGMPYGRRIAFCQSQSPMARRRCGHTGVLAPQRK